jgi:dienelactone hydrolase
MKKRIFSGTLFFVILLSLYCASTNKRQLDFTLSQVHSRLYDLETRGEDIDNLSLEFDKCQNLLQSKKYSEAKKCIDSLVMALNEYYRKELPPNYTYEKVEFQDVFVETSLGRRAGFIAQPAAKGLYPGLIFLRGAGGAAINLKRIIHSYAQKDYVCLAPEFNDQNTLKGQVDLNKRYEIFQSLSCLDSQRIGVVSFSRGGLFAYKMIENGVPFRVWVNYFGVIYSKMASKDSIEKNPVPILILHGKKDKVCPVEWAYNLEKIYQEAGVPYQIKIFDREGHGFSQEAYEEARELRDKFLEKYLKIKE